MLQQKIVEWKKELEGLYLNYKQYQGSISKKKSIELTINLDDLKYIKPQRVHQGLNQSFLQFKSKLNDVKNIGQNLLSRILEVKDQIKQNIQLNDQQVEECQQNELTQMMRDIELKIQQGIEKQISQKLNANNDNSVKLVIDMSIKEITIESQQEILAQSLLQFQDNYCNNLRKAIFESKKVWNNYLNIIKELKNKISDINVKNKTQRFKSDYDNKYYRSITTDLLQNFIEKGANVNIPSDNLQTPLHKASLNGNVQVARLLIQNGAKVKARNYLDKTPLHKAALNGNSQVCLLLIQRGANVNVTDKAKHTPLHLSAWNGKIEASQFLLSCEADNQAADSLGMRPIHKAASIGNLQIIKILIEKYNTSVNSTTKLEKTPLKYAKQKHFLQVQEYLREKGGVLQVQQLREENKILEENRRQQDLLQQDGEQRVESRQSSIDFDQIRMAHQDYNRQQSLESSKESHYFNDDIDSGANRL